MKLLQVPLTTENTQFIFYNKINYIKCLCHDYILRLFKTRLLSFL